MNKMNKLTIVILGTIFATAITPVLASAEGWPQIDQSFYCTMQAPVPGGTYSTEALNANFNCATTQTNALKNWINAILAQLPSTSVSQPPVVVVPPNIVPPKLTLPPPMEGIPETPVKLCYKTGEFATQACDEKNIPVTQEGWSGPQVTVIQDFLKAEGSFTYQQSTGYFGPITRDTVKTFQTKYGLPSTGVVDKPTLDKMKSSNLPQVTPNTNAQINNLVPTSR